MVAVQVSRKSRNQNRTKIFLRSPGSPTWQIANNRPEDEGYLLQLTDQGDLFLEILNQLLVVQKGGTQLTPVLDCKGTVILPYCSFHASVAANGDLLLYEGGIGSPKLYRVEATQNYPTTATYLYDQTGEIITRQSTLLNNGTVMANGNDGSYGAEQYFFRRPGAGNWQHSPAFPGKGYVIVAANRQSEVYTTSRQFPASDGLVYRVNY